MTCSNCHQIIVSLRSLQNSICKKLLSSGSTYFIHNFVLLITPVNFERDSSWVNLISSSTEHTTTTIVLMFRPGPSNVEPRQRRDSTSSVPPIGDARYLNSLTPPIPNDKNPIIPPFTPKSLPTQKEINASKRLRRKLLFTARMSTPSAPVHAAFSLFWTCKHGSPSFRTISYKVSLVVIFEAFALESVFLQFTFFGRFFVFSAASIFTFAHSISPRKPFPTNTHRFRTVWHSFIPYSTMQSWFSDFWSLLVAISHPRARYHLESVLLSIGTYFERFWTFRSHFQLLYFSISHFSLSGTHPSTLDHPLRFGRRCCARKRLVIDRNIFRTVLDTPLTFPTTEFAYSYLFDGKVSPSIGWIESKPTSLSIGWVRSFSWNYRIFIYYFGRFQQNFGHTKIALSWRAVRGFCKKCSVLN